MAAERERRFVTDFFPTRLGDERRRLRDDARSATEDALLILNYHLPTVTSHVWGLARAHGCVCADGGANRLYDELPVLLAADEKSNSRRDDDEERKDAFATAVREAHVPRAIVGDLDSVRPEVLAFYVRRGCQAVDLSHDQTTTDLHKAVTWLERDARDAAERVAMSAAEKATNSTDASSTDASDDAGLRRRRRVLVTGALGGRFDHEMSHLSCLHAFADTEIVLVGRTSTARLIPAGVTTIVPDLEAEGPTCGLFPMLGPATVTTSGLRWDLDRQRLAFGTLISTSNEMLGRNAGDDPPREREGADEDERLATRTAFDEDANERANRDFGDTHLAKRPGEVRVRTDAPLVWTTDVTRARGFAMTFDSGEKISRASDARG